jgi:hypothetical protein
VATPTATKQDVVEDVAIDVPEAPEFFTIPAGIYNVRLVGFKTVPKPSWKLTGEEDEDKEQYEWVLEIIDGEWVGMRFTDYTNRTFHPKATAHKHAAALLGVPELVPGVHSGTGALAGRTCQMWLTEKPIKNGDKKGEMRNWIDKLQPMPTPRMRPQRAQNGSQTQGGPAVRLPGYPQDDDDQVPFEAGN